MVRQSELRWLQCSASLSFTTLQSVPAALFSKTLGKSKVLANVLSTAGQLKYEEKPPSSQNT